MSILEESQLTNIETVFRKKRTCWIITCCHAFEYFPGLPTGLVPDTYKGAVTKAYKYQTLNNRTFQVYEANYGTAVLQVHPNMQGDKVWIEVAIKIIDRRLIAPLRNDTCHSLCEINIPTQE